MKVSHNWLKQWVDFDAGPHELAEVLTMAGLEVDEVVPAGAALDGVVVARVAGVEAHPDADRLRVCSVDYGAGEPVTIVCGAPNVHQGMKAPLATLGTTLPGGMKIKPARLRGVASTGMLCSEPELGLGEDAEGLMALPEDAPVGEALSQYLGLDDHVLEVDLTPNRADCLSVRGLARELSAITGRPLRHEPAEPVMAAGSREFPVRLDAPDDCPRYVGRVIEGVNLKAATPLWMVERLRRSGLRSLHPVVDVTNYVLLELGQPLHAFDLDRLSGGIHVRRALPEEPLELLDGQQVTLDEDMLVIADEQGPVALAGIMGGSRSAVDSGSADIFLESAWFNPATIMGRSRRLGLATESAHRFERGVDPALQAEAVERATALILEIAGGSPGPLVESVDTDRLPGTRPVRLRLARLNRLLGTDLGDEAVRDILRRLGMEVSVLDDDAGPVYSVTAPSARRDIAIEADLIEEVARIHGYNNLPRRRPGGGLSAYTPPERQWPETALRDSLAARGFSEIISWSFVSSDSLEALGMATAAQPLANPLSRDMDVLRTTLVAGMLDVAGANLRRQQPRLKLFELGTCFSGGPDEDFTETRRLGLLLAGPVAAEHWDGDGRGVDFFDLKGEVENLLGRTGHPDWRFSAPGGESGRAPDWLHPGQCARVFRVESDGDGQKQRPAGWIGQLHPGQARRLDLPVPVFLAELDVDPVTERVLPTHAPVARYPAVRRDLSLLVPDTVTAAELVEAVRESAGRDLREVLLFDRYHGKGVESGFESLAIGLIFQSLSATLRDSEVDAQVAGVVESLRSRLNATLRG